MTRQGKQRNIATLVGAVVVTLSMIAGPAKAADKEVMGMIKDVAKEQGMVGVASFDAMGNLALPEGYRQWVFVGAPVTPNELNDGKAAFPEFHHVYIDPGSFNYYQKTGNFRDGAVLVKELATVGAKKAASGNGYFPGEFSDVGVSVKDSIRFANEPGNWGFFHFVAEGGKSLAPTAKSQPTAACSACHQKNAAQDLVFTQHYPVLRAVKPR
jgi:hypothetical protein